MARININDKLWSDPRFKALCRLTGSEELALGRLVLVFRMAQEYYADDEKLIPIDIWDIQGFDHVEKVGFAERHDAGIYIRGSSEHFDWLLKIKASAKAGGLKSAQARRQKYGSAQPKQRFDNPEANPKRRFDNPEAKFNPLSLSLSPSLNLNTNTSNNHTENEKQKDNANKAKALVCSWNEILDGVLPSVTRLTDKRKKNINAQLKKYSDMEYWKNIFELVKASDFLTGRTESWKCTFDWILNENNRTKVEEGNYKNKKPQIQTSSWNNSGYGAL